MTTNDPTPNAIVPTSPYKRVVLKFSGEALGGPGGFGIDPDRAEDIARKVARVHALGVQVAVVTGGGNLWRGAQGVARGMDQAFADQIGIIGTVMNALALQDALERQGITTRVQTAIEMKALAEPYIRLRAVRHMEKGRVVVLAGGTGNPFFTTDTGAALRAAEINADLIIKATQVDGVYTADPRKDPTATRYTSVTFQEVLEKRLNVMDMTAFTLCQDNGIPILVLNLWDDDALYNAMRGDTSVGTLIHP